MRSALFTVSFLAIVILTIMGAQADSQLYWIHCVAKPLIMGSLLIYFLYWTKGISVRLKWLALGAIVLSLAGDVFLMMEYWQNSFLLGLGSFLLAHILYSIGFAKQRLSPLEIPFIRRNPWFLFLNIVFVYWMFGQLKKGAGDMLIPVTAYMLVISLMLIMAFNRQGKVGVKGFRWVAIGALLFIVSDSVLAWNMFKSSIDNSEIYVLGTYGLAQLLIVSGLVEQIRADD